INDTGKVAFIGNLAAGQGIFVGDGTNLTNLDSNYVSSSRTLLPEMQINNAGQVAVGDQLSGLGTGARIYDVNSPNTFTNIALGSNPLLKNTHFDAVGRFVNISNAGKLA